MFTPRRRPGDYVPSDYKEVKMELSQSKDLLVHFHFFFNYKIVSFI